MVEKPTLLLDRAKAERNIERMAARAGRNHVRLRPHFKTHQSAAVGEWFRTYGVEAITVSSVDMAAYFARAGWTDITIAFPVNLRQLAAIDELAGGVHLHLVVESAAVARRLSDGLRHEVGVWLKIDAGYHRTGLPWDDAPAVLDAARAVADAPHLAYQGLLTHAGHTYRARSPAAVAAIYAETLARLTGLKNELEAAGLPTALSVGDTPSASLVEDWRGVDEFRPGNFVFYDLMQVAIGACAEEDVAVALACPVVAVHPERQLVVLYGGAVHLSKESLILDDGRTSYGRVAHLTEEGWSPTITGAYVRGLSQEHGLVEAPADLVAQVAPGDLLAVLPVHSCLTANLMGGYLTLDGERLTTL